MPPDESPNDPEIWALDRPSTRAALRAFDSEHGVERVRARIRQQTATLAATPRADWLSHRRSFIVGVLATGIAAAVVISVGYHAALQGGRAQSYATQPGQRLTVQLADGTQLTLGPVSTLQVPASYGVSGRRVDLSGEAYFAVVHDRRHPFAVHTSAATITDIGTEFDVRRYPDDRETRVAVTQGEVAVAETGLRPARAPLSTTALHAGEIVMVTDTGMFVTPHADLTAITSWRQGGLAFSDTPLRDVIHDLSRTFGLQITLADTALAAKRVTSTFAREPVDQILDIVTQIVGARYEHVGHAIVIRRDTTAASRPMQAPPPLTTVRR